MSKRPFSSCLGKQLTRPRLIVGVDGSRIRERDAEIAVALSGRSTGGPDRSVHADPFVERTYTSQSVAQNEVCVQLTVG